MKKAVSAVMAVLLITATLICGSSSQPFITPEIMSVDITGNSDYGYVDYSLTDSEGNELFETSFLPEANSSSVNPFISLSSSYQPMSTFPASYDSRNNNCITSVKQQGTSGNCWAFSTMSMLESDAIIKGVDDIGSADYSEAHFSWFTTRSLTDNTADPTYGDGYLDEDPFMTGGNWIIAAGSLARWTGAAEDSDYPFDYKNLSAMGNYDESCRYDTGSGVVIESAQKLLDMNDAKEWITEHGSATLAFYYDGAFYNGSFSSYYYNGTEPLNHEITVVGWDDNYSRLKFNETCRPEYNGAWLCKNSWGTNWGDDGYFWLSYYDTSIDQFAGISARSVEDIYRNYTYNGAGWQAYISHTGSAKLSNVFTVKGSELLTSVSTYTMMPDSEIVVYIYKNLPNGFLNPEQGSLAHKKTVVIERPGYHVIDLDAEIALEQGTMFSVVIEYVSDDTVYFPLEANGQGGINAYYSNKGESYLNLPAYNNGWYGAKSYSVENVFIQAFTKCNHQSVTDTVYATCDSDGNEKISCTLCGKLLRETVIPAAGHDFSEWSRYVHDFTTDREVRTRTCLECGFSESESIVYSKNTIKLEDFIQMIVDRIFELLSNIF